MMQRCLLFCFILVLLIVTLVSSVTRSSIGIPFSTFSAVSNTTYTLTLSNHSNRIFEGIGGISGGGATSRLLYDYPDHIRGHLLDLLFKPQFGASLQILKVEIGGGGQTSDGSEPSEGNLPPSSPQSSFRWEYGYEWWLMKEARKRNPDIMLVGLPWAWPGWLDNTTLPDATHKNPFTNPENSAAYVVEWILGAQQYHGLSINAVGCWNERSCSLDHLFHLRKMLDKSSLGNVRIIYSDQIFDTARDIFTDIRAADSVSVLSGHYPGGNGMPTWEALASGLPLWASEDSPTPNFQASCLARIYNGNFVYGQMTATIVWNLVSAYYDGLPYPLRGILTANEPWSGYFDASKIWTTAHHTWWIRPGARYLSIGVNGGSGRLRNGGTYVSLVDDITRDLTIVIEKLPLETSCHGDPDIWFPKLFPSPSALGEVVSENVIFEIEDSSLLRSSIIHAWESSFICSVDNICSDNSYFLQQLPSIPLVRNKENSFTITVNTRPNTILTLTTVDGPMSGPGAGPNPTHGFNIPSTAKFPITYSNNFNAEEDGKPAKYLCDISGSFVIVPASGRGRGKILRQIVTYRPVPFGGDTLPYAILGDQSWKRSNIQALVRIESKNLNDTKTSPDVGVFIGANVQDYTGTGNPGVFNPGVFFSITIHGSWNVFTNINSTDSKNAIATGRLPASIARKLKHGEWISMKLSLVNPNNVISIFVDNIELSSIPFSNNLNGSGRVAIGGTHFRIIEFDDLLKKTPLSTVNENIVMQLIDAGADIVRDGANALNKSHMPCCENIVKLLLMAGTYISSPLHSTDFNSVCAKLLVEAGANLTHLLRHNLSDVLAMLTKAVIEGDETVVARLIEAGVDINDTSAGILVIAVEKGQETIVKQLIEARADVNIQNNNGHTALIAVVEKGHDSIVKQWIDANADVNIKNNNRKT